MRLIRWTSGLLWVGSWFLMVLEVFRWHHMTRSLRFNSAGLSGVHGRAHPGLPLIAAWVVAVAAPVVFVYATVLRHRRPDEGLGHRPR
ncbi:hypothetical protein ACFFWC_12115 [Plantactinospora siamensis]|uniref:Uncharacterized protein n=1 Tax=Plantactinospora siamensis TaxID=555372 RepID=A0ABV6P1Q5_9ACTN